MAIDDFIQVFAPWINEKDYLEENRRVLEQRDRDIAREAQLVNRFGRTAVPSLVDNSPRAEKVYRAEQDEKRLRGFMGDYVKGNLDAALSGDENKVIRAAALGVQSDPKSSEMALYLYAYRVLDSLKEDDPSKEVPRWKRKARVSREEREKRTQEMLPFIIKESIRSEKPGLTDKELNEGVSLLLPLSQTSRTYIPELLAHADVLIANRIKSLGNIKEYIINNLQDSDPNKEKMKYQNFAFLLGDAYTSR